MANRTLLRVHAFVVRPLEEDDEWEPSGGALPRVAELEDLLKEAHDTLEEEGFTVDLVVDSEHDQ